MHMQADESTICRDWEQYLLELRRFDVRVLTDGEYFGELGCVTGVRRTASVAATKCMGSVLSLSKASLEETVAQYSVYAVSIPGELAAYNELIQKLIGRKASQVGQPGNPPAQAASNAQIASEADTELNALLPTRTASL
jgi:CRP-like cAMP-binding protein